MTVMPGGPSREPTRSERCSQPAPAGDGLDNLMTKVDQIFVLMLENRSFDHMLGYLSLPAGDRWRGAGRSDVNGLTGAEKNIVPKEYGNPKEEVAQIFRLRDGVFRNNPAHGLNRVRTQINGGRMDGFAADFNHTLAGYRAKDGENPRTGRHEHPTSIMGYHTAETVPVFDFLARNFMVCDRWFSSIPGPTWPNRQYLYAGHSNTLYDNCFHSVWGPRNYRERMPDRTIFDCLDDASVDWMIYRGSVVSWPQLIPGFTAKGQGRGRVRPYRQLAADIDPAPNPFESRPAAPAGDPAYRLPSVVIVDPDHNAKAKRTGRHNDDQAPSDIARGQQLIGEVYEIVRKQADRGRRPLLVVTYDEHGGFFDHEPPDDLVRDQWVMGTPPSDRSAEELAELAKLANRKDLPGVQKELAEFGDLRATWPLFTRYGVRVPALVISPFVDAGSVWCWRLDHLSLTKSILQRFCPGVELIGEKRTKTNDQPAAFRARLDGAPNLGHLLTLPEPRPSWPSAADAIEQARRGRSRRRGVPDPESVLTMAMLTEHGCFR